MAQQAKFEKEDKETNLEVTEIIIPKFHINMRINKTRRTDLFAKARGLNITKDKFIYYGQLAYSTQRQKSNRICR
jgi:hypothetical protein